MRPNLGRCHKQTYNHNKYHNTHAHYEWTWLQYCADRVVTNLFASLKGTLHIGCMFEAHNTLGEQGCDPTHLLLSCT